ncbi:MAG: sensor histidine kinase [Acutalibacteraceae bacterium]
MKKIRTIIFVSLFCVSFLACIFAGVLAFVLGKSDISVYHIIAIVVLSALFCGGISALFSKKITEKIAKPINEIDLSTVENSFVFEELTPFSERIKNQSAKIRKNMERIKREHKIQDKIRQEFTANVSHELKTPLTSISGYAEIMKNGMVKDEDVTRFSEKIYSEAQRLISLVEDIIKLSRLDENAVEEQKERIELCTLCKTIISRLEPNAKKKGVTFEFVGAKTVIIGIPRIIDEMIYNLCDNAIKYNKDNGKVTVSVMQTNSEAVLAVKDTGIGIPKGDIKRVFERFYRVNKSHSREIGGTGLGLSIVKHGAAVHNAELNIESEEDKGTTISIRFAL